MAKKHTVNQIESEIIREMLNMIHMKRPSDTEELTGTHVIKFVKYPTLELF